MVVPQLPLDRCRYRGEFILDRDLSSMQASVHRHLESLRTQRTSLVVVGRWYLRTNAEIVVLSMHDGTRLVPIFDNLPGLPRAEVFPNDRDEVLPRLRMLLSYSDQAPQKAHAHLRS